MATADSRTSIDMRHIRLVAAIAEHGTITQAARSLGLTQPAVSHQLSDLEVRLRTPLFIRTSRRMVMTPAGEHLARIARTVLAEVSGFERQVLNGQFTDTRASIRIATECYTVYHWLPAVLKVFKSRWPGIELRIAPEHTSAPHAALRDGSLDAAIVHTPSMDRRIRTEPLFDDELVVIVSPNHRFAKKQCVQATDFISEHLIVYSTGDRPTSLFRDILDPAGVVPERTTRIQLTEAILELVAADLGIAVLSRWAVLPHLRSGAVSAVRLTETGYWRTWYFASRADDPTTAFHLDLVELVRRNVAGGPTVNEPQRIALLS